MDTVIESEEMSVLDNIVININIKAYIFKYNVDILISLI